MHKLAQFSDWHAMVNEAALAAFAVGVCFIAYKIVMHGGRKAAELGERYVASTEKLHDTLRESDEAQKQFCARHAENLAKTNELLALHDQSLNATHQALVTLVEEAHSPDAPYSTIRTNEHLRRLRQATFQACEMCRAVAKKEFPQSSDAVSQHCDEIERIIGES